MRFSFTKTTAGRLMDGMMSENEADAHDTRTDTGADDALADNTTTDTATRASDKTGDVIALTGDVGKDKDIYAEALGRAMEPIPEAVGDTDQEDDDSEDTGNGFDGEETEREETEPLGDDEADSMGESEDDDAEDGSPLADEETDTGEDGIATEGNDTGGKPPQFRFRPNNELDEVAFKVKKEDPELTLSQALEIARVKLGIKPETAPAQATESVGDTGETRSSSEIAAEIRAKKERSIEAMSGEYDPDAWGQLQKEILTLEDEQRMAMEAEETTRAARARADAEAQAKIQREFAKYDAEAIGKYEANGITNPNSRFYQRMQEIHQAWEMAGDPRVNSPMKTLEIANIVALEQGVKPGEKPRKAPAKAPSTQAPTSRKTQAAPKTAGANARTQEQTHTSLEKVISGIKDPREYEEMMTELGV